MKKSFQPLHYDNHPEGIGRFFIGYVILKTLGFVIKISSTTQTDSEIDALL